MSALFTDHAISRMKAIALDPGEKQDLSMLLNAVDAATGPTDLVSALPGTVELVRNERGKLIVARRGSLRAVVTVDEGSPDQMIVASVYRAGDENEETREHAEALASAK